MEKVINIDKEILGGTPVFNGTRVPIKNLFDYLETGETIDDFLEDFDGVKREQVIKLTDNLPLWRGHRGRTTEQN